MKLDEIKRIYKILSEREVTIRANRARLYPNILKIEEPMLAMYNTELTITRLAMSQIEDIVDASFGGEELFNLTGRERYDQVSS